MALVAAYGRRVHRERARLFETTRAAVNRGFAADDTPFDQVFREPQPAAPAAVDDETAERWW